MNIGAQFPSGESKSAGGVRQKHSPRQNNPGLPAESGKAAESGKQLTGEAAIVRLRSTRVQFEYDLGSKEVYVNVVDGDSGKVLRQIPDRQFKQFLGRLRELVGTYLPNQS